MNGGGFFTLIRSWITSQISAWTDFGVSMICYAFIFTALPELYHSNLSVVAGAVAGGIINCTINYRFTFHAKGQSIKAVIVKYILVWGGSCLLNMYGTTGCAYLLSQWDWLLSIGFKPDGIFAASRLIVSGIVSIAWNFVLQRNFVYRPSRFDPYAIKMVNAIMRKKPKNK